MVNLPANLDDYQHVSAEYLFHAMRFEIFTSLSPSNLRTLLSLAMQTPIRSPGLFKQLKPLLLKRDNAAVAQVLRSAGPSDSIKDYILRNSTGNEQVIDRILDAYLSVQSEEEALNLLRYLIFFPNLSTLNDYITFYQESKPQNRAAMIPSIVWNAETI